MYKFKWKKKRNAKGLDVVVMGTIKIVWHRGLTAQKDKKNLIEIIRREAAIMIAETEVVIEAIAEVVAEEGEEVIMTDRETMMIVRLTTLVNAQNDKK